MKDEVLAQSPPEVARRLSGMVPALAISSCGTRRHDLIAVIDRLLLLQSFLHLFYNDPSALRGRCDTDVPFRAEVRIT